MGKRVTGFFLAVITVVCGGWDFFLAVQGLVLSKQVFNYLSHSNSLEK
jgi:hypothetical protein